MKYALEQRLRLIDFLLFQYGYITRSALMDYFAISTAQSSGDFKTYMELAPVNMKYSLSNKRYERTDNFQRLFE